MPFGFHGVFAALTGGRRVRAAGLRAGGPAGRRGARSEAGSVARDPHRHGDRRRAVRAAADRDDRRPRPAQHRRGLEASRSAPTRPTTAPGTRWRSPSGAGWLAKMLLIDAVISPAGTGVVYVGDHGAPLVRARRRARDAERAGHARTRRACRSCPSSSASVIGTLALGPFKSWTALVNVVTGATAIMYAFAPVSLAALHRWTAAGRVPTGCRCRAPAAGGLLLGESDHLLGWLRDDVEAARAPCCSAWCCSRSGRARAGTGAQRTIRNAIWMAAMARRPRAPRLRSAATAAARSNLLPDWVDVVVVIAFSLAIFYWAVGLTLNERRRPAGGRQGRASVGIRGGARIDRCSAKKIVPQADWRLSSQSHYQRRRSSAMASSSASTSRSFIRPDERFRPISFSSVTQRQRKPNRSISTVAGNNCWYVRRR